MCPNIMYRRDCNGCAELFLHLPRLFLKAEAHASPEPSTSSHLMVSQGHAVLQTECSVLDLQAKIITAALEICTPKGNGTLNVLRIFPSILCQVLRPKL